MPGNAKQKKSQQQPKGKGKSNIIVKFASEKEEMNRIQMALIDLGGKATTLEIAHWVSEHWDIPVK